MLDRLYDRKNPMTGGLTRGILVDISPFALFFASLLILILSFVFISPASVAETLPPLPSDRDEIDVTQFDHLATGFPLEGQHAVIDCESCHTGGVFQELATECVICHDGNFAVGQHSNHIPTSENCDVCHTPIGFELSAMTGMDHTSIGGLLCSSCHDNVTAIGKSQTHLTTQIECDSCHSTNTWKVSAFDHSVVAGQPCIECHNNTNATGKSINHINTTDRCEACHTVSVWIPVNSVDHSQVIGECTSCHNNLITGGKTLLHMPTSNNCAACHSTTAWSPVVTVNHTEVSGTCVSCHNNEIAPGMNASHINASDRCDTCHSVTAWVPAVQVDHTQVSGTCVSCHDGIVSPGKPATHITTTNVCESCHGTDVWVPATAVDHAQVTGTCVSCHDGAVAPGQGPNHILTSEACDVCHSTDNWLVAAFDHTTVAGQPCFDCHEGTRATGKPNNHIETTDLCEACHGTAAWIPVTPLVDHAQVIGTCESCHDNVSAIGKGPNHLPTTDACDICHTTTEWLVSAFDHGTTTEACIACHDGVVSTGRSVDHITTTDLCEACHTSTAVWIPVAVANVDHAQVIGTCISCHDGTIASGKGANHINSTDACEACHQQGPTPWIPVANADVDHNEVIGVCSACHDNVIATGQGPNHIPTPDECDTCHTVGAWLPVVVDHTPFIDNCVSCHDGIAASGKGPTHINSSDQCHLCHEKAPLLWTPVTPAAVDHTQTIGTCISCHDGIIASGRSTAHISTSDTCDACHQPGPTPWSPVDNAAVNHNEVVGSCISCHDGTIASGKSTNHINTTDACEACHLPGPDPWVPVANSAVDHAEVIGACATCHDNVVATGQGPTHIPTSNDCDTCHQVTAWTPVNTVDHSSLVDNCVSCHDGIAASGKGPTHITSSDECHFCHAVQPALWTPVAPAEVDHTQVTGTCISCHDGVIASGRSTAHINTTDACEACHQPGPVPWTPIANSDVDHNQVVGTCLSCHDGVIASGRSVNHINTTDVCEACHGVPPQPWSPLGPSATDHAQVVGTCDSCHDGVISRGMGVNHVVTAEPCDVCHTTDNWLVNFDHATVTGQPCFDCHDGVVATGQAATHVATTNLCEACHEPGPVPWVPVEPAAVDHTQTVGVCSSCHDNVSATGMGATHIPVTDECDTCHTVGAWIPAVVDHAPFVDNCFSCHDGVAASGKSATHINTTDQCHLCHEAAPALWMPVAPAAVDHSQVIGSCISCHDGTIASGKSATHINSSDACEACHAVGPTPWIPVANANVDHNEVVGVCSSCHDNVIATGQGPNHVPTAEECDTCHSVDTWVTAVVDHDPILTNCVSCHDGTSASGKGATHINSSDQCELCHEKAPALWTPVAPAAVDHSQIIGSCISCHDGTIASGKGTAHINSSDACDTCHAVGPTPWVPVDNAAVDHNEVIGVCSSCHDNVIATGQGATHIVTTEECDTCHTVGAWVPATVDHTPILTNCLSCHDGVSASGKGPAHINSSDQCELCHAKAPATWTPLDPAATDHTQVIGTCISCHDGVIASGRSTSHITTTDTCDACHAVGPTPWTPVANADVNHNDVVGTCLSCHDGVIASGMSANHINTTDVCEACHGVPPQPWSPLGPSATDHTQVVGTCESCHDNVIARGVGANHVVTAEPCDVCHTTDNWLVNFDHATVVGQPCFECHDGVVATGQSATHVATTNLCEACHQPGPTPWVPVAPSAVDHAQTIGVCSSCHDNVSATGMGPTHIPTTDECDVCHVVTAWIPASVDHTPFVDNCMSCHDGVTASGKSATHINTTDECHLCHEAAPAFWAPVLPAAVDHTQVIGTCASCHDGTVAQGKGTTHISTSDLCEACHQPGPVPWVPVDPAAVDHAQVLGTCFSCHDGTTASGKSTSHIASSDVCEACHQPAPTPWLPVANANVDHNEVTGSCVSCHDGTIASGMSATHINTTDVCEACHQPGPIPWIPVDNASVDHAQVTGVCSSCHDNVIATGMGPTHIAVTQECDACHAVSAWVPVSTVDHTDITTDCISCHDGTTASGKTAAHLNTSDVCETCHAVFPATWVPVDVAAVDHTQVIGICASCHNGTLASGKSATHINSTNTCDACHQPGPVPWIPVDVSAVDHGHVIGTCVSCHDGTLASGKSATHINSSDACDACHAVGPTPWIPVENSAVDHNEVLGVCSSCHDNVIATGQGPGHVPTTEECQICHTVGAWVPATVDHTPILTDCLSCHDGVSASGKGATHINSSDQCELCHAKAPATWVPIAASAVDHTQVVGTCISCHDGTIASGKSATHIPSSDLCDACHQPGPSPWVPVVSSAVNHNEVTGVCSSCHDNVIATGMGPAHIPTTGECDTCHAVTAWVPVATVDHSGITTNCISCHDGTSASGKTTAHPNTTDTCESCHAVFPATWIPVEAAAVDHTQVIGTCVSCHNGTAASGKSVNHINTSDTCDACHQVGPTPWIPVANIAVDHGQVIGTCISCHDGVIASGRSTSHIATTDLCEACHEPGPSPWAPVANAAVNHDQVLGTCLSCHDGIIASGKSANHIASSDLCETCHSVPPGSWLTIAPAAVDHTQVVGTCVSCHDGIIATGKSGTHIASTNLCEACHAISPLVWAPVAPSAVDHSQVIGVCSSCHNNIVAQGKTPNHIVTTQECDNCHTVDVWIPAEVDHTPFTTNCTTCHNGVISSGKGVNHINSTDSCELCHAKRPALWAPIAPSAVDHTQVIGICSSCHNGTVASGKSVNHINSSNTCDACHQPGPVPWQPLAPAAVDHTHVIGTCASCHNGTQARGKSTNHINSSELCDACHLPGPTPWIPVANDLVDHGQVIGSCFSCHDGSIASGKSINHINTTNTCDACHLPGPTPWTPVANSAVNHNDVLGVCSSCHDNATAQGKSPTHIQTTLECDSCHITTNWLSVTSVDHTGFVNNCITCHDGVTASGMSANHIATSNTCDACHAVFPATWVPLAPSAVDHTQVIGSCISCHNGIVASGKSLQHIASSNTCDACHQPGPAPWVPVANAAVDHGQVIGSCISCHNGTTASGKSANHISSSDVCDACHQPGPSPWIPVANAAVDHNQVIGTCVSCHNNTIASGKSLNHINSTDVCDACHLPGPTPWMPVANSAVDHAQVLGVCSSCHNNVIATGMGPTHVQTTLECDSCHIVTNWLTVSTPDHTGFVNNCFSCHNGTTASGKSVNHINTTNNCDTCHAVFPALWTPVASANVDHGEVIGSCFSCHNGTTASGKSAAHINTSNTCDACHQPGPTPWQPVQSAAVDHGQVIGTCVSCHNNVLASGKSANHINTTDLCDACHLPGPTPWIPVANSAVDHNQVLGVCSSCHNNIIATGMGPTHVQTTLECDNCHNVTNWLQISTVDHTGFVNNCFSCHDGTTASGKSANHINTTNNCDTCHAVFPALWAPVASANVDHGEVVGTCFSCHNGTTASGKSVNHINTSNTCDACHQPGPVPWMPVASAAVDHGQVIGTCFSCHNGTTASGKSVNHINTTNSCDTCHQVGPTPWMPVANASVDHTQVIGTCVSCHNNTVASGKSANHINSTDVCDACHLTGPTPWTPVANNAVDHNQVLGVCSSCHNNIIATGMGPTHVQTTLECDNCHNVTNWLQVTTVDHSGFVNNCFSCHNGTTASGKSFNHINTTNTCDACHEVFPALWTPVATTAVDHTQVIGTCFSCHNGTVASGKSINHINSTNSCDACHQTGPSPWTPVQPAAVNHNQVLGSCISCHNGTTASGKSINHINSSNFCDACHLTAPTPWTPVASAAVDHTQVIGTCFSCHNGTVASGKSANHISSSNNCDACHAPAPTPWTPVANSAVDHTQVLGVCSSCHDNIIAQGKGAGHIQTTLECDSCHNTSNWNQVTTVDHTGFVNNCFSCHNGTTASGKSGAHINTSNTCDACHAVFPATWSPVASAAVDHAEVIGTCFSCHNGTTASGKSINHISSSNTCDACHQPGPTPWTPVANASVDHAHVIGNCFSCHNGTVASGKSANHINTTNTCDMCHQPGPTPWSPVPANAVDHTQVIGTCISCHNNIIAGGKPGNHINTSDVCDACHQSAPTPWNQVPANAVDHNEVIGVCSSCHNNILAQGMPNGHIPTTLECDSCHVTTSWTQITVVDHTGFVNNCFSCHNGTTASGKDANHINSSNSCDACHQVFPANWAPVSANAVDHNEVIGTCISCHNGTTAIGKPANHINSTNTCDACHQPGPVPFAPVQASAVDHTQVIGTCISCHNNVIAGGKPGNHPNTTDLCDACHMTAPNNWLPFISPLNHDQVLGTCFSCHDGGIAQGKPGNHPNTTNACEACHSVPPVAWANVITPLDHNEVIGTCFSCHNGVIATGKPANHPNTTNLCEACHSVPPTQWTNFITPLDHNEVIGTCFSCHNGTIAGGKPGNHPNTTNLCEACHSVPPTSWASVITPLDHNQVIGTCFSCHNGTIATGKPGNHPNTTNLCEACHSVPPTQWAVVISPLDHSQVIGTCVSCHDGIVATGKPGNHPNTSNLCEACHSIPPTPWASFITPLDHNEVIGTCFSCHDGGIAQGKPGNHPNTTNICEACHLVPPSSFANLISPIDHNEVIGTCFSCHNGTIATGKPGNHPSTTNNCEACHSIPPTNWSNFITPLDHNEVIGSCVSCHNNVIAQGKPANHPNTTDLCEACHMVPPATWLPFIAPLDHSQVLGVCVSCHDGGIAGGKPGNHPPTSDVCEACHMVPPATFANLITPLDHSQVLGTCFSCHDGGIAGGKPGIIQTQRMFVRTVIVFRQHRGPM